MWFPQNPYFDFQPPPWDLGFLPQFSQPFQPAYAHQYGYAHSVGSSTVRFTPGTSRPEPGCVVASCATVAKVPYETARAKAANVLGFDGSEGISLRETKPLLSALGVNSSVHSQSGLDWSQLPDLAIISVHQDGGYHAVVFKRKGGEELIYDYGRVRRPSDYRLADDRHYVKILR